MKTTKEAKILITTPVILKRKLNQVTLKLGHIN